MHRIRELILKAERFIERESLLVPNDCVLIGLSGGADSVALAYFLSRQGYSCRALHCNFHLRGEESDRDEAFVRDFCRQMQLPLKVVHFDTVSFAKEHKVSIEMAARELRYSEFDKEFKDGRCSVVAVGHHRDDSIETLLLNLTRGSGIRGLSGIVPRNGHIIRPLLVWSKEDILYYVERNSLRFITDSTNLSSDFKRNFIRNELLPMMARLNPAILDALERTAANLRDTERFVDGALESLKKDFATTHRIEIKHLMQLPAPEFVLYELLSDYQFNRATIQEIGYVLKSPSSGKIFYAENYRLLKDRDWLLLEASENNKLENIIIEDEIMLARYFVIKQIVPEEFARIDKKKIPSNTLYIDKEQLLFPLVLRGWQHGDSFVPFGMKGIKKVSDFFSDMKMSLFEKERRKILQNGDGRIIWLVALRADDRFRVGAKSKQIISIEYRI